MAAQKKEMVPDSMVTRLAEPVMPRHHFARHILPAFVTAPCVGFLLLATGLNLDFSPDALRADVDDVIFFFAVGFFLFELGLELGYGDRRAPFFKCWLAFHVLVAVSLFVLFLLGLALRRSLDMQAYRPLRLLFILRMADVWAMILRATWASSTGRFLTRRDIERFLMMLTQAFYGIMFGLYFFAIVLRMTSIYFGNQEYPMVSYTVIVHLPFGLAAVLVYVLLSVCAARVRERRGELLDSDERDEDMAILRGPSAEGPPELETPAAATVPPPVAIPCDIDEATTLSPILGSQAETDQKEEEGAEDQGSSRQTGLPEDGAQDTEEQKEACLVIEEQDGAREPTPDYAPAADVIGRAPSMGLDDAISAIKAGGEQQKQMRLML